MINQLGEAKAGTRIYGARETRALCVRIAHCSTQKPKVGAFFQWKFRKSATGIAGAKLYNFCIPVRRKRRRAACISRLPVIRGGREKEEGISVLSGLQKGHFSRRIRGQIRSWRVQISSLCHHC